MHRYQYYRGEGKMKVQVILILAAALTGALGDVSCPKDWVKSPTGSCFKFVSSPKSTWDEAQSQCSDIGGSLATLETQDELYWLKGYRNAHDYLKERTWVGGFQKQNGQWMWQTKTGETPITFFDWAPTEPNSPKGLECLQLWGTETPGHSTPEYWYRWNDQPCNTDKYSFICERNLSEYHKDYHY